MYKALKINPNKKLPKYVFAVNEVLQFLKEKRKKESLNKSLLEGMCKYLIKNDLESLKEMILDLTELMELVKKEKKEQPKFYENPLYDQRLKRI